MKAWISRASMQIAAFYLGLLRGLAILYLALFIPFITVAELMRWFNIWHFDDRASDDALIVAIVLTIFLLVLKVAGDTEEIKNRMEDTARGS